MEERFSISEANLKTASTFKIRRRKITLETITAKFQETVRDILTNIVRKAEHEKADESKKYFSPYEVQCRTEKI